MASLMRALLVVVLGMFCTAAMADPVTFVAFAAEYIGSTAAAWIYTNAAMIAVTAVSVLSGVDARRKASAAADANRAAYNASLQDRNVSVLSNDAPWRIVYGSPAPIGGALVAILSSGAKDEFKHLVIVFAAHECTGIDEIYIEGDPVGALDGNGWATAGKFFETAADQLITEQITFTGASATITTHTPTSVVSVVEQFGFNQDVTQVNHTFSVAGSTVSLTDGSAGITAFVTYKYGTGTSRVNVQKHLSPAGVDTADTFLMAAVPAMWTSAHKLSGYSYIVLTLDQNMSRFQGGPPNVTAKLRGKKVYDFRTGTTIYSSNPALCAADFLTQPYGYGASVGQIDSAAAIAAANACDSQGFNCHGAISTDASRDSNLQALEESMAGRTHWSGGVWRIVAGIWTTPVLSLTDAMLAAPIEVSQAGNPRTQRYNSVRGKYIPAAQLGVTQDFTAYTVPSYIAADGPNQWLDVSYPFTASNAECQKLAAIAVEKSRAGLTITYPAHLGAWKLQPGDRVYVTNAELGFAAKTFRVQDWTHVNNAPLGLVLVEDVASMYTGTYSNADPLGVTSNLADPWAKPAAPGSLAAVSGVNQLIHNSDGTITPRVYVTWTAPTVRAVLQGGYTQIQWRSATATDDQWTSMDVPADTASQYIDNIKDGSNIAIRVRFITGVGAQGAWATVGHTIVGQTAAPASITALATTGGMFQIALTWTFGASLRTDLRATEVWGSTTNNIAGAVRLSSVPWPEVTFTHVGLQSGQTWYYWLRLTDTSGNASAYYPATTAGVAGTTNSDPSALLTQLKNSVGMPQLAAELAAPIVQSPGALNQQALAVLQSALADYDLTSRMQFQEAVTNATITVDPITGQIRLLATAVVTTDVEMRLTAVEFTANADHGTLTSLVASVAIDHGNLTTAQGQITTLAGQVTAKADAVYVDNSIANATGALTVTAANSANALAAAQIQAALDLFANQQTTTALMANVATAQQNLQTQADALSAEAKYRSDLVAAFVAANAVLAASVTTEQTARATADSANASAISAAVARLDSGDFAAVKTQSSASASALGGVVARWGVQVQTMADGRRALAGLTLLAGTDGESVVAMLADKLIVYKPDGTGTPKQIVVLGNIGGVPTLGLDGNLIVDGSIVARSLAAKTITAASGVIGDLAVDTLQIAGRAVTVPVSAYTDAYVSWTALSQDIQTVTITTTGEPVILLAAFSAYVEISNAIVRSYIYRDGVPLSNAREFRQTGPAITGVLGVSFPINDAPAAGTYTYSIHAEMPPVGSQFGRRSLLAIEVKK